MPPDEYAGMPGANRPSFPTRKAPPPPDKLGSSAVAVDATMVHNKLLAAMNRIAELEAKLDRLLSAVSVAPGGDVEIRAAGALKLTGGPGGVQIKDGMGNGLTLSSFGLDLQGGAKLSIAAPTVKFSCGMLTVDAGMSKFSGVLKSDTVITSTVTASTYSPGAGNLW